MADEKKAQEKPKVPAPAPVEPEVTHAEPEPVLPYAVP